MTKVENGIDLSELTQDELHQISHAELNNDGSLHELQEWAEMLHMLKEDYPMSHQQLIDLNRSAYSKEWTIPVLQELREKVEEIIGRKLEKNY